jgi:hypothetical protein
MNPEQQTAFDNCYTQLKQNLTGLIDSYKTNSANQIIFHTMLITMIVKQVETCGLKGADKKSIAIELGRKLIIEIIEDKTTEAAAITMYDMFATSFIDQLVDVASNVNIRIRDQSEVPKTNPPEDDHKDLDNSKSPVVAPKACCVLM